MKTRNVKIQIMGCCAGMLIAAGICEKIADNFSNPYLALFICLAAGFGAGYILTSVLLRILAHQD